MNATIRFLITFNFSLLTSFAGCQDRAAQKHSARTERPAPMDWFQDLTGVWNLEERLQTAPNASLVSSKMTSRIHFLPNRAVLAVEETSADGNNVFLGFHAYDSVREQYVNWGAASLYYEGWGHGTLKDSGRTLAFRGRGFDPKAPDSTVFEWRGEWKKTNRDQHVFRAYVTSADSVEFMLKESIYRRKQN